MGNEKIFDNFLQMEKIPSKNGRFCRLNIPPGHIWTIQIPDSAGIQMIAVLQNLPGQCRFDG